VWGISGKGAVVAQKVEGVRQPALQGGAGDAYFAFDASLSNSIYGANTTVQAPARQALMIIRA